MKQWGFVGPPEFRISLERAWPGEVSFLDWGVWIRREDAAGLILYEPYCKESPADEIRRIRIDNTHTLQKAPIIVLSFFDSRDFIRKAPHTNVILFSDGVYLAQLPMRSADLHVLIQRAKPIENMALLKPYLGMEDRKAALELQIKHVLSNVFGPLHFLEQAYAQGELGRAQYTSLKSKVNDLIAKRIEEERDANKREQFREHRLLAESLGTFERQSATRRTIARSVQAKDVKILFVDDEHQHGWSAIIKELFYPGDLNSQNKNVICYRDVAEVKKHLGLPGASEKQVPEEYCPYDLILLDLNFEGDSPKTRIETRGGYRLLRQIHMKDPSVPVVMFTASEQARNLVGLERWGILGYFSKAFRSDDVDIAGAELDRFREAVVSAMRKRYLREVWKNILRVKERLTLDRSIDSSIEYFLRNIYYELSVRLTDIQRWKFFYSPVNNVVSLSHLLMRRCMDAWRVGDEMESTNSIILRLQDSHAREASHWLNQMRNKTVHRRTVFLRTGLGLEAFRIACYYLMNGDIEGLEFSQAEQIVKADAEKQPRIEWHTLNKKALSSCFSAQISPADGANREEKQ